MTLLKAIEISFTDKGESYITNEAFQYEINKLLEKKSNVFKKLFIPNNDFNKCPVLTNCLMYLREMKPIIDDSYTLVQIESLETFVDEATKHKEYCTPYMLRQFSNSIYMAIEDSFSLFDDSGKSALDSECEMRDACGKTPITASQLKEIYEREYSPKLDIYHCEHKSIYLLLIQVCYCILMHYFRTGNIIKRCEHCGSIYIPKRTSDKYCTNPSPEDASKTCGEYVKRQKQIENQRKGDNPEYKRIRENIRQKMNRETDRWKQEALEEEFHNYCNGYHSLGSDKEKKEYLKEWEKRYPKRKEKKS